MSKLVKNISRQAALIIVDVQRWLFERQDPIYNENILIKNINMLEEYAHTNSLLVVYVQHESSGKMKNNSPGWELHKGLNPKSNDFFIGKRKGNAFFETSLHTLLQDKNITLTIVCGLLSQQCIQKTTLGALELGYETILVSDAHSNSGMYPLKNITMVNKNAETAGATLMTTIDINSQILLER